PPSTLFPYTTLFRSAVDALERAASLDPTVHFGDVGAMTFQPLLQARWTGAECAGTDPTTVVGFSVPRARLTTTASMLDAFRLRLDRKSTRLNSSHVA